MFFILAAIAFVASLVVHLSTFLGRTFEFAHIWPLHVGIFLVFIPSMFADPAADAREQQRRPRSLAERGLRVLGAYAIINFVLSFAVALAGADRASCAELRDGRYVVMRNGQVVEEFTQAEYQRAQGHISRTFSALWMLFYWASAASLLEGLRRKRDRIRTRRLPPSLPRVAQVSSAYRLPPAPSLSLWAHATLKELLSFVCFFGFPLAAVAPLIALGEANGPWGAIGCALFLPAAFVGVVYPAKLFAHFVPARCPNCNGRCFFEGPPLHEQQTNQRQHATYRCRDCGHASRL